jgi:hypothetical protein
MSWGVLPSGKTARIKGAHVGLTTTNIPSGSVPTGTGICFCVGAMSISISRAGIASVTAISLIGKVSLNQDVGEEDD